MKLSVINPDPTIAVVANIPHSSSFIPTHIRNQFVISDEDLQEENRQLVDWFTDDLYSPIVRSGGCALHHNVSRFVLDPERFEDDALECMAARGMGAIYTHGCSRQRIRRDLTSQERELLLNEFYRPYHAEMLSLVLKTIEKFGHCVLVDCHSYPDKPLPYEIDGESERPDFVLGTDPHHTPKWIADTIGSLAQEAGYSFGLNRPFAGTIVPLPLYKDPRVTSFMVEINRKTYMNEEVTTRAAGFSKMQNLIGVIVGAVQQRGSSPATSVLRGT